MPEGRPPISSARIATGDIARHTFAVVRKGYDPDEVRAYLQSVSRSIELLEEHERELQASVAEADERAAHPVIDEATLTASLGQHSAQILRHAHDEAARIVAQAQERAATLLRETQSQIDDLQARAEASQAERVVEVELLVTNAEHEARAESERIVAAAVAEGEALIARAKEEGRALLEQVQEARRRVLSDLAARRRALGIQIEQLRAARDEMASSVHGVRDRVDSILTHLDRTDDAARAAAHAVGDHFRLHGGEAPHDEGAGEAGGPSDAAASPPAEGPEGVVGLEDAGGAPPAMPSVDELFARIRAGSTTTGLETTTATPAVPSAAAPEGSAGDGAAGEEGEPDPGDPLVARRDELLAPAAGRLSRSLKRALGDDQNRMLDRLRSEPALPADDLVGPEDEHVAIFTKAARRYVGEAFSAGAAFAGAVKATPDRDAVEEAATGLARTVVSMLRRQIAEGSGDTAERVGATFREWRGERVERLAGDSATQAFSAGVGAAAGGPVRWVVTSESGCSDCEDNVLAGAVAVGEEFPTGHAFPPAHSGCRCLIVPADG